VVFEFRPFRKRRTGEHVDSFALWKVDPLVSPQNVAGKIELTFVAGDSVELN